MVAFWDGLQKRFWQPLHTSAACGGGGLQRTTRGAVRGTRPCRPSSSLVRLLSRPACVLACWLLGGYCVRVGRRGSKSLESVPNQGFGGASWPAQGTRKYVARGTSLSPVCMQWSPTLDPLVSVCAFVCCCLERRSLRAPSLSMRRYEPL